MTSKFQILNQRNIPARPAATSHAWCLARYLRFPAMVLMWLHVESLSAALKVKIVDIMAVLRGYLVPSVRSLPMIQINRLSTWLLFIVPEGHELANCFS